MKSCTSTTKAETKSTTVAGQINQREATERTRPTGATHLAPNQVKLKAKQFDLYSGNVLDVYASWPTPTTIISDGAYGVRGFNGDTSDASSLVDWYRPHIEAWTRAATPATTLWFWGTEVGWATVHAELNRQGWDYVQTVVWDKGVAHIAGNVNGKTIRRIPVVTEICVLYQRRFTIRTPDAGELSAQAWLRHEWQRSGLPMRLANDACGVKNAATRKYLTADWMWYFPPGDAVEAMARYCNAHGKKTERPYFEIEGGRVTANRWDAMRYSWNHVHGLTNVWQRPPLHDSERLKGSMRRSAPRVYKPSSSSATHLNQKPLEFMERLVHAVTNLGDVVWEPFGGLATGSVAAVALGRRAFVAEIDQAFAAIGLERLAFAAESASVDAEEKEIIGDHA